MSQQLYQSMIQVFIILVLLLFNQCVLPYNVLSKTKNVIDTENDIEKDTENDIENKKENTERYSYYIKLK